MAALLEMPRPLWQRLVLDLRALGGGRRESGAFLLGTLEPRRAVISYLLYGEGEARGEIDYVAIRGVEMARAWVECERRQLQVIGDVHTHPGMPVQSLSDRQNPIVSIAGHVALILPRYAQGSAEPKRVGLHLFLGCGHWKSWFRRHAAQRLLLT